ncbi:MAG: NAD-dependent dehydratase [Candidatus Omnitrophica bacterium CG11_big_fil_rev_8_21_14_0_20_63_9]|nr:MAG: NAD-dependent dehydratase [Candidatus Omnitrophica bacterium CG11_big_fil_rev_8_21_14_0_20_63_9]
MRILITGGAGFIGSHLCDRFLADGDDVLAVDNLLTGSAANLQHLESQPRFRLLTHDITTPLSLADPVDYVLHFASPASPIDYLRFPLETMKVGSLGTLNALELARAKGAKFLIASTSEVYGDPEVHPQPESYWGHVNPIGPRSVYDEAKRFAEALTMAYYRYYRLDTRIIRIFNTYGPRMRLNDGRAVPTFIGQALRGEPLTVYGEGSQTRSFCYVDDLVEGIRRVMGQEEMHDPINLGNPDERTILEIANKILASFGAPSSRIEFRPLPVDDPKQRRPDIHLARTRLGWSPAVSLDEGLRKTIAWFRQHAIKA